MKGITYDNIESMTSSDRNWYLNRLYRQLKKEADEVKKK
jgi:cyanate lyase